jgi:hypothetical protein
LLENKSGTNPFYTSTTYLEHNKPKSSLEDISKSHVFWDITREGFKVVGDPEVIKVWRPLSVTTNLGYENSL